MTTRDSYHLLYIGHASAPNRNINKRLRGYFNPDKTIKNTKSGKKAQGARYVGLLALPTEHGFEAPAIEEWLLARLNTQHNKVITQTRERKAQKDAERIAEKQLIKKYQAEYNELLKKFVSQ